MGRGTGVLSLAGNAFKSQILPQLAPNPAEKRRREVEVRNTGESGRRERWQQLWSEAVMRLRKSRPILGQQRRWYHLNTPQLLVFLCLEHTASISTECALLYHLVA